MIFLKVIAKFFFIVALFLLSFFLWLHSGTAQNTLWMSEQQDIEEKKSDKQETQEEKVRVTRQDGTVLKLDVETYLEGVVGSEMPASFEMEALKAQCVAARTFVKKRNYEVDDTTRTQVYHDDQQMRQIWGANYEKLHARVVKAIEETKGEVMTYEGKVISAVFFSGSCGKTANSEEYWQSKTPYLRSVDSHWDKEEEGYEQEVTFNEDKFHELLGFANKVSRIEKPVYYDSGYVKSITIDKITFTGREIREKLGLRSSSFTIKKDKGKIRIQTKGFGHGLGMSQYGAQGMAKEGYTYKEILTHYYTGVKIAK